MHNVSALWDQIIAEPGHKKEVKASIHGIDYGEKRIVSVDTAGRLFDAPSVGNAIARTLRLVVIPYDGPNGSVPPLSEIRLYVRLVSADGLSVSEFIPKGVFFSDTAELDPDTGAVSISAFDALALAVEQFGVPREGGGGEGGGGEGGETEPTRIFTVAFHDGYRNVQKFRVPFGDALPAPTTPTHEGQQFLSWEPDPADTPTVTRNLSFAARWAQKHKVVFEGGAEPQTFYCFAGDPTPTPETPSRDGFSFNGWLPPPPETVAGDATYTAQWAERTSVAIATYPARSDYYVGETLDYAGLSVIATYANGDAQDVTADCALLPAEGTAVSEVGDIMVDVRYEDKSIGTFWVAVASGEGVVVTVVGEALSEVIDYNDGNP